MITFEGRKNPHRRYEAEDRPAFLAIPELPDDLREYRKTATILAVQMDKEFNVDTEEGMMHGKVGDWLALGIEGELYPIDADIFSKTYELVNA
jgi:hypothetical protein